jgi:dihydroorotase
MEQNHKETFLTGTKAAASSGITTVFNMPNTVPPAIDAKTLKKWILKAENNIFVDVGFIAGVPQEMDEKEIKKIIDLGIIGFKIYPLNSLNGLDWTNEVNIESLLNISSKYQIPIFIHPDWPLTEKDKNQIYNDCNQKEIKILEIHNNLYPIQNEIRFVEFIIENYEKSIIDKNLPPENYPIIHFCHISCKESYLTIKKAIDSNKNFKMYFEITPHHLLLSYSIRLKNENFGKVLPPLRNEIHSKFLFQELKKGNIYLIGTDHAPHTIEEKSRDYLNSPSGFPGFETYPLIILNLVCNYQLPLEIFVKIASENPSKIFNLKNKGFIREEFDADLVIIDKVPEYELDPQNFKTKAKFSPFEDFPSSVQIWKVFLRGIEINAEESTPKGNVIK